MASAQKPRPTNHFRLIIGGRESVGQFRECSGLDVDKKLWEWRHNVELKGPDSERTDCTLELIDYDGSPIVTYTIKQAWPSKYTGVAINAGSNEIAVEGVTICHEGFERM